MHTLLTIAPLLIASFVPSPIAFVTLLSVIVKKCNDNLRQKVFFLPLLFFFHILLTFKDQPRHCIFQINFKVFAVLIRAFTETLSKYFVISSILCLSFIERFSYFFRLYATVLGIRFRTRRPLTR